MNRRAFFEKMLKNLDESAQVLGRPGYHAQSVESCGVLYQLCVDYDPDVVLDVGTGAGASCLALALALANTGKPLAQLHTIGVHQGRWHKQGVKSNGELALEHGIDVRDISVIEADFCNFAPAAFIGPDDRALIFWDIHDHPAPKAQPSVHLLDVWLEEITDALVGVHDIHRKEDAKRGASKVVHWDGTEYWGFYECRPIVEWLNVKHGRLVDTGTGVVHFELKGGRVV